MTKIKICGLSRKEDIDYVNEAMPDFAGFVIDVPTSRRNVSTEQVRSLRKYLNPQIQAVGVFVDAPQEIIRDLCNKGIIDIVQLHGIENEVYIMQIRGLLPKVEIWKAFTIKTREDLKKALSCTCDRILLDSGKGTGNCFDWSLISADNDLENPFILAGGLGPDNIEAAIKSLHPWVVDLSSGVESEGKKDRDKILAAVAAVRVGTAVTAAPESETSNT